MTTQPCPSCDGKGHYRTDSTHTMRCTRCKGNRTIPRGQTQDPRLLHRASDWANTMHDPPGYTQSTILALRDEPEAVTADQLDHYAQQAHQRDELHATNRLAALLEQSHLIGRNHLAAIHRALKRAERDIAA